MEPEGFSHSVAPHLGMMVRVAAALVGMSAAEDAAQEALVRAWRKWGTLRDGAALRSWLIRITINVCHDWQRGALGAERRHEESVHLLPNEPIQPAGDPGAQAYLDALDLLASLTALAPDLRAIVALRYFAGMDATEIGQALSLPPATVRTRLKRALNQLRITLSGPDDRDRATQKEDQHGSPIA